MCTAGLYARGSQLTMFCIVQKANLFYYCLSTAVKKGRYTLERRAETIIESRKYWTAKTDDSASNQDSKAKASAPDPTDPEVIAKFLFSSGSQRQSDHTTNVNEPQPGQAVRPAKRSSHSFSSTSSSFDSDSGLQIQDDIMSSESMLSLLTNNDPILMGSESAMDIPETSKLSINEAFDPKSLYTCEGPNNTALKSLLATPSSPYYKVATPDTTTLDSEQVAPSGSAPLPTLHEFNPSEDVSSDSAMMPNIESQLLGHNVNESTSDTQMPELLENFSTEVDSTQPPLEQEISQNGGLGHRENQSQAMLDKLLGLKTLFKDPNNTTEFKTDYLKGFNTEKQDCDSLLSLFSSIQHPADALDIALARADDENLNKLIDQTIEAFDKQNFLTRGFLAKMPDYQHKFLVMVFANFFFVKNVYFGENTYILSLSWKGECMPIL